MLWRKMLRDLKDNKGAYFAGTVVIIIGLMVFSAFSLVFENLQRSQQEFYNNHNFAQGFAQVIAIPPSEINKLEAIEGISEIQGRIIKDVRVLHPEKNQNVYLRLVTVEPQRENPLNGVMLTLGEPLNNKEPHIWIDNKFYAANNLQLPDQIDIIADGKKSTLQVIGVGLSPEFIYALRTSSDLFPDPENFGIAFIPLDMMNVLFPQEAINDLIFNLTPGADFEQVKKELEHQLKPYGLKSIYPREDQMSNLMLTEELKQLETMSKSFPIVFLTIAAMILYIMLKRLIEQQRGQIGILKAFGYTYREIMFHYLSYALIIGLCGGIIGGLLGIILAAPFTDYYLTFFNMPDLSGSFSPRYLIYSILLSLVFAVIAGYQGCKQVITLEPAEAMRPPAPVTGGKVWLERISLFWNMLTVQGMMAVRNLSRNTGRSVFVFLGIMFCFAITSFTWSMNDMIQKLIFDQHEKVEVYDVKITMSSPQNAKAIIRELENFPGVTEVEALAEIPVTLKHNWHKKDVLLLGIEGDSNLYNILDKNYQKLAPPEHGLLLSERLASLLEADIGTKLSVETLVFNSSDPDKQLEVVGIIPQYLGINAYMDLNELQNFINQGGLATSFMLKIDEQSIPLLQEKYLLSDVAQSIDDKGQRLQQMEEIIATSGGLIYTFAIIGMIIGFAIIYSTTIITLSERGRELASMMVLGMTPREVLSVVTFEQWFTAIIAMIAGIPMAKLLVIGLSNSLSNDVFTMPTDLSTTSFILAFLVTGFSIWIAQRVAAKKVKQLSLVEVLKSRE